jgi:hypothetical protein
MATFQSFQINEGQGGTTVTITKPTSLAVGDFMLAFVSAPDTIVGQKTWTTLSGWTNIGIEFGAEGDGGYCVCAAMWKIADSSDVAASDFTFTYGRSLADKIGVIYRFTGVHSTNPVGTPSHYTTGVTPDQTDTILLMLCSGLNGSNNIAFSDYAITNNNPSWTEDVEIHSSGSAGMSVARGSYSPASATGVWDFTLAGTSTHKDGLLMAIRARIDSDVTLDCISIASSAISPTATGGTTLTLGVISLISSAIDFLFAGQAKWSANSKSTTITPTNQTKHSANWINQIKNTMTNVVNQTKS